MKKPVSCEGCPLYQTGEGFCPDELHDGARITFIAQNPGETEEAKARPLIGRSGQMVTQAIAKYGLKREDANWLNILRCRWNKTNELPPEPILGQAVLHCTKAYLKETLKNLSSNVYVPLGDLSLNSTTGRDGIGVWRGSVFVPDVGPLKSKKVLPTIHPSAIFQDKTMRSASKSDFARIAREANSPTPTVVYDDNFQVGVDAETFIATLASLNGKHISLDIETTRGKPIDVDLHTIGIAWSPTDAMNYQYGKDIFDDEEVLAAISAFTGEIDTATPFDYTVLTRLGVKFKWENCHDLTLLHSRFDIECSHDVAFICSMWTEREYWKWLNTVDPLRYNCLDCVGEWEAFHKLSAYCKSREPGVWKCYNEDRKMIRVAVRLHLNGFPMSEEVFASEREYYLKRRSDMQTEIEHAFTSSEDRTPPNPCERHPRYTGKTPVKLRKGDESPCEACGRLYGFIQESKPLKLTQRSRVKEKLKEMGMVIPKDKETGKESTAKGKLAAMFKKYANPILAKLAKFYEDDTVITRYFALDKEGNPKTRPNKKTGRVHPIWQMHTAMHRWSCRNPNAQQQKKPEEEK